VKSLREKRWCERPRLPNAEVMKWTRTVDLDGRVAPDLELWVWSTLEEKYLECSELPNAEVLKKIITIDHKRHVVLDL
jgi:hypothetical protein